MNCKWVEYQSDEYQEMLNLRYEVLRKPLGLNYTAEQLSAEATDYFLGGYEDDKLVACLKITPLSKHQFQLKQMAVHPIYQGLGHGAQLVTFAESNLKMKGANKIILHARQSAIGFYQKLGYECFGDEYFEVGIPHRSMQKYLQ